MLILIRPQHETRDLVCECLRPVFRKDEESAWTIIASGSASSPGSFINASSTEDDTRNSVWSERSFAFINDLLTAPVYKRLALSALRPPRPAQKSDGVLPLTPAVSMAGCRMLPNKPWLSGSVHGSSINTGKRHSTAATTIKRMNEIDRGAMLMATDAASESFSSGVVTDLSDTLLSSRWLPLRASLQGGLISMEDQLRINAKLLDAAEANNLVAMAEALDAGADINAVRPGQDRTALQFAICHYCPAVRFLLRYQNVNVHVRDYKGRTLLLTAVQYQCENCIQSLLDLRLCMTDEDEYGVSAFNYAVEYCHGTEPLLALLRHATKDEAEIDAVTALDRDALYKLCCGYPLRRAHAAILVHCGWSLATSANNTSSLRWALDILEEEQWLLMLMLEQIQTILEIRAKVPLWNAALMAATKGPKRNTAVLLKLLRTGIEYQHLKFEIYGLAFSEEDHFLLDLLDGIFVGRVLRGVATNSEEDLYVGFPNVNNPPISASKDDSEAVMLHVADVTHSNAVLRRLQRTRVIDFLKDQKLGTGTDQRQEVNAKHTRVAEAYTGHMRHFKDEPSIAVEENLNHVCCELDAVETQTRHEEGVPRCHGTDFLPEEGKKAKQNQDQNLSQLAFAKFRYLRLADEIFQIGARATPPFHSPTQATI
jgi:ankyrin repeat protein